MRNTLRTCLAVVSLCTAAFGCANSGASSRFQGAPLALDFVREPGAAISGKGLAEDGQLVLRDRLDLAGPSRSDAIRGTSFSHRSQRYHVYPFTTYGASRVIVDLEVLDPEMQERAGLWVVGPRLDDNDWGAARGAVGSGASVTIEAEGLDEYLVVVGPSDAGGFLPRLPGVEVLLEAETAAGAEEETARIEKLQGESGARTVLAFEGELDPEVSLIGGRRFLLDDPLEGVDRADELAADAFALLFASECVDAACVETRGDPVPFAPRAWTRYQLFSPEAAKHLDDTRLGSLHDPQEGFFTIYSATSPHRPEASYQILEAIGPNGRPNDEDPSYLRVVPLEFDGCQVDVVDERVCSAGDGACRVPKCLGVEGPAPADLPVRNFRATGLDFDETSLYNLAARCEGDCSPTAPPTRYPVYLAHGFNSSKEAWDGVVEALLASDERWRGWLAAESVPAFEPVWRRAEHLRRNLSDFLEEVEARGVAPREGDTFQRVNVVAHSMGGLDSRYLVGHEKYNNAQCHQKRECSDADGNAVPCCAVDAQGNAIPWRARLASVTTLSTPHRGSSFADLGVSLLERDSVDWVFRKAARYVLGLDTEDEQQQLRDTLFTLSNQFARETMTPEFPPPQPERVYSFACATGPDPASCSLPPNADLPPPSAKLPAPNGVVTLFAWASEACLTGACGSFVDPGLALSWGIVRNNEGASDGVVAIDSARFGIYMGVRANDHFHWNRLSFAQVVELAARAFGVKREPVDRFHTHWLGTLSKSGY